ncbi:MAG: ribonuclease HII [Rubrimonas sp.]|uniref:ribonuclease HII n=1 Tax=Rubrimonas sp. TaxID=2036015 RepID=UPI002FDE1DD4
MRRRARPFAAVAPERFPALIGADEAGRGALCGPVVAAAVWFDPTALDPALLGALDDSKKLAPRLRADLAETLRAGCRVAVAARAARAIDGEGVGAASLAALRRAIEKLGIDAPAAVDGLFVPPGLVLPCVAVVRGDGSVPQIAAASILAKTTRDRLMGRLALRHRLYGWERNMGYGAPAHLEALARLGPSPHHRRSFAPVARASSRA